MDYLVVGLRVGVEDMQPEQTPLVSAWPHELFLQVDALLIDQLVDSAFVLSQLFEKLDLGGLFPETAWERLEGGVVVEPSVRKRGVRLDEVLRLDRAPARLGLLRAWK